MMNTAKQTNGDDQFELHCKRLLQITDQEQLKKELEATDFSQCTLNTKQNILHFACIEGKKDLITLILEIDSVTSKLNINQQDSIKHWSPLFYVIDSCDNGLPDIVEILIKNGAKVNIADRKGITPLHLASFKGQDDNVEYLLKQKASVNAVDALGRIALTYAIIEGQTNCVQALIEAGADINVLDVNNESLLHYAVVGKGNGLFYSALLIEKGINVDIRNKEGNSALMLCAKKNPKENVRVIQLLINAKVDTTIVNNNDDTFYSMLGQEAKNNQFSIKEGEGNKKKQLKDYKAEVFFFLILPLIMIWIANKLVKLI